MKKIFKKISVLFLIAVLSLSIIPSQITNAKLIDKRDNKPMAWPGRPGNENGIGIETNVHICKGEFKYHSSYTGEVRDLQRQRDKVANKTSSDASAIISFISGVVTLKAAPIVALISSVATALGSSFVFKWTSLSPVLPGDTYRVYKYKSDNCTKDIIKFYYRYSSTPIKTEQFTYKW